VRTSSGFACCFLSLLCLLSLHAGTRPPVSSCSKKPSDWNGPPFCSLQSPLAPCYNLTKPVNYMKGTHRLGWGSRRRARAAILNAGGGGICRVGIGRGLVPMRSARAAHVNKALLLLLLQDKMHCTKRCSTMCSAGCANGVFAVLESKLPHTEDAGISGGVLRLHRGQIRGFHAWCRRSGCRRARKGGGHMRRVAGNIPSRSPGRLVEVLREGTEAGEFRAVNPTDFLPFGGGSDCVFISAQRR